MTLSTRAENRFAWLFLDSSLGLLALLFLVVTWLWARQLKQPFFDADFSSFYLAARICRTSPELLYDTATQKQFQQQLGQFSLKPYIHPPFETVLFWPLGFLSYQRALGIWLTLNLLFMGLLPLGLYRTYFEIFQVHRRTLFLLALGFYPFLSCLLQGQDSILYLSILVGTLGLVRADRQLLAGGLLAFGLIKPQLTIFLLFPFLIRGRLRFLFGFLIGLGVCLAISVWTVSPAGLSRYHKVLSAASSNDVRPDLTLTESSDNATEVSLAQHPGRMHNWIGQLSLWGLRSVHGTLGGLILTLVGCSLLVLIWRKNPDCQSSILMLQYAATLLTTMLCSIHFYLHDAVIVYLVMVHCFGYCLCSPRNSWSNSGLLLFVFASPLVWIIAAVPGNLAVNPGVVWMTLLLLLLVSIIRRNSPTTHESCQAPNSPLEFGPVSERLPR